MVFFLVVANVLDGARCALDGSQPVFVHHGTNVGDGQAHLLSLVGESSMRTGLILILSQTRTLCLCLGLTITSRQSVLWVSKREKNLKPWVSKRFFLHE